MARFVIPKNTALQASQTAAANNLIEQYNKMSAHGGTDMFMIPQADLQVILVALGQKVKIVEE